MEIEVHHLNATKIAEIVSDRMVISSAEEGLDLLGDLYYQGFDKVMMYSNNITPEFFNLKTGIAGELLQKFSNYRVRLAIIGDFTGHNGKSIKDFIFESNKTGQINFVGSKSEAIDRLLKDLY